jgi:putative transposase
MGAARSVFPAPCRVGRARTWPLRRIVEAILYLLRGGLPWRMLPHCFPPVSTVRRWFSLWRDNGLWLSLRAVCDLIASDRPLYLFDLAHFPNRRVIRPGWKTL